MKAYREVRPECSGYIIEVAANVAISLREMSLVRCTWHCQNQLPFPNSVDEAVLRIRREFPLQWADCKDTSRQSETATLKGREKQANQELAGGNYVRLKSVNDSTTWIPSLQDTGKQSMMLPALVESLQH